MNREEVLKLAQLARIDVSDSEAESLAHEFDAILGYVGEIKNANVKADTADLPFRNVLREDTNPHESGIHTEAVLNEVPNRDGQYVKVKKIL